MTKVHNEKLDKSGKLGEIILAITLVWNWGHWRRSALVFLLLTLPGLSGFIENSHIGNLSF